jgi:hypothetical protein
MEDVSFQEATYVRQPHASDAGSGMIGWLIRSGYADGQRGANIILLIAACVIAVAAIGIFVFFGHPKEPAVPPGARLLTKPGEPPRLVTPIPAQP